MNNDPVPDANIPQFINHPAAEIDNPRNNLEESNTYIK